MKQTVLFVLVGIIALCSARCYNEQPPTSVELQFCEWYEDETCCTSNYTLTLKNYTTNCFPNNPTCCEKFSQGCQDYVNLYICKTCSPEFTDWIRGDKLRVCASFADKFFSACKDDELYWQRSANCRKISEVYKDSKDFIQNALQTNILYEDGDGRCFNSGLILSVSLSSLLTSFLITMFF